MTNRALLNNIDHANLKVIARHDAAYGDSVNLALIFPTEFAEIQRDYPILFRKNANGAFQAVALLGLDEGENLFLDGGGWRARYVPAVLARGPFSIALKRRDDPDAPPEPMIHVDLDDPRVGERDGEPVFLPHGGNTPYLERVSAALRTIHQGAELEQPMFAAFEAEGLIAPVRLEIKLSETETCTIVDHYSVSESALAGLDGAGLERLNRAGFLQAAFHAVSSIGNVSRLIELKNRKRAQAA